MQKLFHTSLLCAAALTTAAFTPVNAATILQYGDTYLGVNDEGHLNVRASDIAGLPEEFYSEFGSDVVGLWRAGLGDATSPGCLCEGWGVAASYESARVAGWANEETGGAMGLSDGIFGATDASVTSMVNFQDAPISVTHAYGRSLANGVFQASVTIANNADTTIGDVVYRRAMDWDIPPTEFSEYVTHSGVTANLESNGGNVRYASDNGFASSDPRSAAGWVNSDTVNTDFTDNGPADHGSVFDFAFGDLAAGESRTFNIFYGSAGSEIEAISALTNLGVNVYSLGQQSDAPATGTPATFMFAFGGVGGVEPGENASNPILPFVPAPGEFVFEIPEGGNWFDPPYAYGFEYTLEGGALFSEVMTPDASFGFGDIDVMVDGVVVATLAPGGMFDFSTLGMDISSFMLVGLDRLLDIEATDFAAAFPTFLDWTGTAERLLMNALTLDDTGVAVPEPAVGLLVLLGLGCTLVRRKSTLH